MRAKLANIYKPAAVIWLLFRQRNGCHERGFSCDEFFLLLLESSKRFLEWYLEPCESERSGVRTSTPSGRGFVNAEMKHGHSRGAWRVRGI